MLTNVIRISEKRMFIPSENASVLLTKQQFKEVYKELGIMLKLRDDGPLQMTVYKDHKKLGYQSYVNKARLSKLCWQS